MKRIRLCGAGELDIVKTFECGQCFRWNAESDGAYVGVVAAYPARIQHIGNDVFITSDAALDFWREYFDLETHYDEISKNFSGEYLETCREYGRGIRILRQDAWEALCSFIISQCNNITRIKGIVERMCSLYGEKLEFCGKTYYTFPTAEKISELAAEELAPIRSGYRAEYIIAAAKAVVSSELNLDALRETDYRTAVKELRTIHGIGEKVANCVVLFGLGHMEAFPIDVWMKRALKENFPADFKPESLGPYAGLAQQYIFYYARSNGK